MNKVMMQEIHNIHRRASSAPRGQRTAIYEAGAAQLGISLQTFYRKLKAITVSEPRKRRSDKGNTVVPIKELRLISALLIESIRANNKQLSSVKLAVERLRANGKILGGRVDESTGEFTPFHDSTINRALYRHNLHPDQLLSPEPAITLASRHPNHVWQIDASLSTQFYMDDDGAKPMNPAEYYDGKPENMKRIERKRLWRYAITDHTSAVIYVQYVLGAESAENLCNVLIDAMHKRGDSDPFHGVPFIIMTDPGAAMKSAMFRNLCRALSINLIINKVGNARAKGQVEQAHNIIEREFESGLKLMSVNTLDAMNELAGKWMRNYNAFTVHRRLMRSRYDAWMHIKPDQLRIAPGKELCREMAMAQAEERQVSATLQVSYRGNTYDVSNIPGVLVNQKILITRNAWRDADTAHAVIDGEDGREQLVVVNRIEKDQFGFSTTSAYIGDEFKRHQNTPAQTARKLLEQMATGTETEEEAKQARKAKKLPFGGEIDPYKHLDDKQLPAYIKKRGTELTPTISVPDLTAIETPLITVFGIASRLQPLFPSWSPDHYAWLSKHFPGGAKEEEINAIADQLRAAFDRRPTLAIVKGA